MKLWFWISEIATEPSFGKFWCQGGLVQVALSFQRGTEREDYSWAFPSDFLWSDKDGFPGGQADFKGEIK